ncbi:hypothetical protein KUTeg_020703 [Tegillarca granosa]|uniref:Uncharacterized protein n=1 Tax=Tegillarca granosa TaxID=220873 RepID=A0ABQ9E8P5_TEGGR|nr:hypothetical protein KUTeg_020703 [Tegillarca granosa]
MRLDPSSDDEYELFQLFERYYMSCAEHAFPLPKDLPDEESNNFAEECYRQWNHPICQRYFAHKQVSGILSELPAGVNVGSSMYENFDEQLNRRRADSSTSRRNLEHVSFPPLASFLRLLEKIDMASKSKQSEIPPPRRSPIDIDFLEDVALHHTRMEAKYDLNTVNF